MPSSPNGSQDVAPAAEWSTGMSLSEPASKSVRAPTAKTSSAATAMAVTTRLNRRASPTPHRWMPMKRMKHAR